MLTTSFQSENFREPPAVLPHATMSPPCEFCDFKETEDCDRPHFVGGHAYELFHSDCNACHYEGGRADHLCPFCQHLRLRHLCLCEIPWQSGLLVITFGNLASFSPNQGCAFCHLIQEAIKSNLLSLDSYRMKDLRHSRIMVHKGFSGSEQSGSTINVNIRSSSTRVENLIGTDMTIFAQDFAPAQKAPLDTAMGPFLRFRESATVNDVAQCFINWDRIRQWMNKHRPNNAGCSGGLTGNLSEGFRVIDVARRCLVRSMPDDGFVALSYMWGPHPNLDMWTTTLATVSELETDGGITRSRTPQTIKDAMQICDKVGQRYLWVDRLCIIQDDDETKKQQIQSMHSIFASAKFTIVVLEGTVDDGIPGVSCPRKRWRKHHEINGMAFIYSLPSILHTINFSTWATRGWTYQEVVMSERVLYFSECQAFFEDTRVEYTEDDFSCSVNLGEFRSTPLRPPRTTTFGTWKLHVSNYTKRQLTRESDIYNAFTGIASALYGDVDESYLYGLPRPNFDMALLWHPEVSTSRRTSTIVRDPGVERYPTWSWTSITEPICYNNSREWVETLVRWRSNPTELGVTEARTPQRLERSDDPDEQEPSEDEKSLILAISWSFGCTEADWPFKPLSESTFEEIQVNLRTTAHQPDTLCSKWYQMLPEPMLPVPEQEGGRGKIPEALTTRAQTAVFKVKTHETFGHEHRGGRSLDVLNEIGECIGILDSEDPSVENDLTWSLEKGIEKIECMGISLGIRGSMTCLMPDLFSNMDILDQKSALRGRPELDLTFRDRAGDILPVAGSFVYPTIPVVNVMAIRWQGPYAYRVTIGWILLTKWVKAKREFKDVLLR